MLNEFDRVFERPLTRNVSREWGVALDVAENDDAYVIRANLPGINPDEVEITLEDNVLTLKGEVQGDDPADGVQYHLRERRFGQFSRSIRFPMAVNSDAVEATYEGGILSLYIPKAEEVKPKRIAIKAS